MIIITGVFIVIFTQPALASDKKALDSMPMGTSIMDEVFSVPGSLSNGEPNNASIVASTNVANPDANAVQVTDGKNYQLGAVWSKEGSKVDLNKDFTASMWMYFGNKGNSAADGMAFVIQNAGGNVISTSKESLGVWGIDQQKTDSKSDVAARAIQNSWALEFDTHLNKGKDFGRAFDLDSSISGPHIASNYPGDSETYQQKNNKYYSMVHNGLILTTLSDGNWHHLTLKWSAPSDGSNVGKMTYTYNDKDPSSGADTPEKKQSQEVSVDLDKLNFSETSNSKKAYWGFTGATGSQNANQMVVFDKVPDLVNANVSLEVLDETTNEKVLNGSQVNSGDKLKYIYHLKYDSGNDNWKSIQAKLTKSQNVDYISGEVNYIDGKTDALSDSELTSNSTITHTLSEDLGPANSAATMVINGIAKEVDTDTQVVSSVEYFNGSNYVDSVPTPSFTILKSTKRNLNLSLNSSNNSSIQNGDKAIVEGEVTTEKNNIVNSEVVMHPTLNDDSTINSFTLNGSVDNPAKTGSFNLILNSTQLKIGENKLVLYATDKYGNRSNSVTFKITLVGNVSFASIPSSISFQNTRISANEMLVPVEGKFSISVKDDRAAGADWRVYAVSSTLKSDNHILKGSMVYIDKDGDKKSMNQEVLIGSGTSSGKSTITNITDGWSTGQGIFLDVDPSVYEGDYAGEVNWILQDTPGD